MGHGGRKIRDTGSMFILQQFEEKFKAIKKKTRSPTLSHRKNAK
jgi:hypothetical protein